MEYTPASWDHSEYASEFLLPIITPLMLDKIEFDIDHQTVYIVLSENHQLETLDSILGRFGVNNYTVQIK